MASYAALVSLAQTTYLILNNGKYSLSADEKEEITSIREYLIFLIPFLENFPEKANRLDGKIRDLANEAEDIIEYFMWKQLRMRWCRVGISRDEFENELQRVREKIGAIAGEVMDDRLSELPASSSSLRVAPTNKDERVIGLDDDLMAINDRLCGLSSKLEVIPIVGMGGIGKTTLARAAYDDQLIMERFEIRAWVTVSQEYSAREIISRLLKSFEVGRRNEDETAEEVYKTLVGRRYLVVLDDVWSTKAWDDVRKIFPDDNNGSRIMLTTRLSEVAAYVNSCSPPHEMRFMVANQSWYLLKQRVFSDGRGCPLELEDIGKEIAGRCGGLPLVVVLVAGILSAVVMTPSSWRKMARNVNSVVDGTLEEILSLSYTHLPHHLRPCFLYMGAFPEDYEIHVSRLIKLWVAEGFLRHGNGCKSLEDEAEEYLEDLVKRNLVLVTRRKTDGKIKSCSLHDLVREMCIRKAHEEKFLLNAIGSSSSVPLESTVKERRVSISHSRHLKFLAPTIHTIISFLENDQQPPFTENFTLLRVLDVMNSVKWLPCQIFELFHLRYLAFSSPMAIPAAISKLQNLHTLINYSMSGPEGSYDTYFPTEIWRMPQLRHLIVPYCRYMLPDPPKDASTLPLEHLQTISVIKNLECRRNILHMIPNLKKLVLVYRSNRNYQLQNLTYLHKLEKLKVIRYESFWEGRNPVFPVTLKKLTLVGGRLPWNEMNIVGSLPSLEVLKLRDFACSGDIWKTVDGEFRRLKYLLIRGTDLEQWKTESSHFPRLKCLVLLQCPSLKEIPEGIGEIPTLELIEVDYWNKSLVNSAKQILEDQQNYGNYALQVHGIRSNQAWTGKKRKQMA